MLMESERGVIEEESGEEPGPEPEPEPEVSPEPEAVDEEPAPAEETVQPVVTPSPAKATKVEDKKPAAKPKSSTPITPVKTTTPAPAPVKTNWGRKLVLEEKEGHVLVSCMRSGGIPAYKRFDGSLDSILDTPSMDDSSVMDAPLRVFLAELEEQWQKEAK